MLAVHNPVIFKSHVKGTDGENGHGRVQKSKDRMKSCRKYCSKQSNL